MGLIYNAETAVKASIQQVDREETAALNSLGIYGRSQDLQTVPWSITDNGDPVYTEVITTNIIVTGVIFNANCKDTAGVASVNMYVEIAGYRVQGPVLTITNGWDSSSVYVPIPNWIVEAGQEIVLGRTGGSDGGSMSVIGYFA